MQIIVGKTAGFCYGVKMAVDGAIEQAKTNKGNIFCLGELVHNKQVILDLEKCGVKFIENIQEINNKNSRLIIRAHGVNKGIYDIANSTGIELIDYTCPNVLKIHKIVQEFEKKGYYIFLTGIDGHPEIIGTKSYCGKNFSLISTEDDVEIAIRDFEKSNMDKLLLISQTTYNVKKFQNIKKILEEKISKEVDLIIKNTICLATEQRQKEMDKIADFVDMVIIIGGKNSSNTKKLYEIALEKCKNTVYVEKKEDLENLQFNDIGKVGIMAGASTPHSSIDEVVNFLCD